MDAEFGYVIFPGTLRIFQYQNVVDTFGIPPTIQITFPASGTPAIYGSTLTVTYATKVRGNDFYMTQFSVDHAWVWAWVCL